jgi:large subunit ribosomal protein L31
LFPPESGQASWAGANSNGNIQDSNVPFRISNCQLPRIRQRRETIVKEGIHPQYQEVEVHCACGAKWKTRSTRKDLHLEICSNCHPFFTGRQKLIDTEGRVDRFTKKFGAQTVEKQKTAAKAAKDTKAKKTKAS